MSEQTFTLPSFAKINWHLKILGKRSDGFHELCTIFQIVSLRDDLIFSRSDEIILSCDNPQIPIDDENLIVKAAKLLKAEIGCAKGARIHLEKRIPSPGGLGGGSSNAAVALIGLARLWKLEIPTEKLCELGGRLGSDVPFFFYGGTAVGVGRGTEIFPVEEVEEKNILIVAPNVAVSTAAAFARINAAHLTNNRSKSILQICRDEAQATLLSQSALANDFEKTVFENEPEIARVKQRLLECGSVRALMSGSGASVFGVFNSRSELTTALKKLKQERNWRVFPVGTISRREYLTVLKLK